MFVFISFGIEQLIPEVYRFGSKAQHTICGHPITKGQTQ